MRIFAFGLLRRHECHENSKAFAWGDRAQRLEAFCPAMRRKGRLCLGAVRLTGPPTLATIAQLWLGIDSSLPLRAGR